MYNSIMQSLTTVYIAWQGATLSCIKIFPGNLNIMKGSLFIYQKLLTSFLKSG